MSKRKARLIECNDKRYTQYYNIYISRGTIQDPILRGLHSNYVYTEHNNSITNISKKVKSIIKGVSVKNNKKSHGYISFNYQLFQKKHFENK
jgi:hypothetical protein